MKKRIVVVCPGRGSYTKESLGYLSRHQMRLQSFIHQIDEWRKADQMPTLTELDSASTFSPRLHTVGENASPLIYACSYTDFTAIDWNQYELVAITGNSMGWYIALALGGALKERGAYQLINSMGAMMKDQLIGGQIIYPLTDENWQQLPERKKQVDELLNLSQNSNSLVIAPSIYLGGYIVLGANSEGISLALKQLPPVEHFPFQLVNHGAFHTPLMQPISQKAFSQIPASLFQPPRIPLIDGRGHIWKPYSTDTQQLYQYTLGSQVTDPYSYTTAITVALKEYNPDHLWLLGPGNSLGGPTGQILVQLNWRGMKDKKSFSQIQKEHEFIISSPSQFTSLSVKMENGR